jgi:hypothetical protein
MGSEDHTGEHSLDELARGLASGTVSRRKALGVLGNILAGTLLASVPGIALSQRAAAEAVVDACKHVSACCACTYVDRTTGEVIKSTCSTMTARGRCNHPRIQSFTAQCEESCSANVPAGAFTKLNTGCEIERDQRFVCRRFATGERFCRSVRC